MPVSFQGASFAGSFSAPRRSISPRGREDTVYPLPQGEGGQRPGEGLRRRTPRRLASILELESA